MRANPKRCRHSPRHTQMRQLSCQRIGVRTTAVIHKHAPQIKTQISVIRKIPRYHDSGIEREPRRMLRHRRNHISVGRKMDQPRPQIHVNPRIRPRVSNPRPKQRNERIRPIRCDTLPADVGLKRNKPVEVVTEMQPRPDAFPRQRSRQLQGVKLNAKFIPRKIRRRPGSLRAGRFRRVQHQQTHPYNHANSQSHCPSSNPPSFRSSTQRSAAVRSRQTCYRSPAQTRRRLPTPPVASSLLLPGTGTVACALDRTPGPLELADARPLVFEGGFYDRKARCSFYFFPACLFPARPSNQ